MFPPTCLQLSTKKSAALLNRRDILGFLLIFSAIWAVLKELVLDMSLFFEMCSLFKEQTEVKFSSNPLLLYWNQLDPINNIKYQSES